MGRLGRVTLPRLVAAGLGLVVAAGLVVAFSGRVLGFGAASAAPINGVPDVTGAGNAHGSISLAALTAVGGVGSIRVSAPTVSIDGLDRGYLLIEPAHSTGAALPLIVVLGGVNASPTQEAERDEFLPLVAQDKAVLVYPAAYGESWNVGVADCCGPAATANVDDVSFVEQVASAVTARQLISTTYLVGFSNGGKLAYQVMCDHPQQFAALAVTGAVPLTNCAAPVPRPVYISVGTKDTELPLQGQSVAATDALAAALTTWRGYDGCKSPPRSITVGSAVETTWASCADGTRVVSVLYSGLDHEWPSTALVGADAAGAKLMWAFLSTSQPR